MPHILFAEDEAAIRSTVVDILEFSGFSVTAVANGSAALVKLRGMQTKPDLIVSDLMMPSMNGCEFIIAARKEGYQVPVIFMTGFASMIDDYPELKLTTLDAIISKPFKPTDLIDRVNRILGSPNNQNN